MTPEERWIKIEKQSAENQKQIAENAKQIARMGQQFERKTSQIDAQIEKNTAAIRDLIVVSRTVLEAQQASEKRMDRMHSELKAEIEQLIKTVNAFLKGFQKPNGNQ
jgi:hypothetical protein